MTAARWADPAYSVAYLQAWLAAAASATRCAYTSDSGRTMATALASPQALTSASAFFLVQPTGPL